MDHPCSGAMRRDQRLPTSRVKKMSLRARGLADLIYVESITYGFRERRVIAQMAKDTASPPRLALSPSTR
jgi:hypothetical protein